MSPKKVSIPLDLIVEILKNFDEETKEEIFERVYLEEDTSPLLEEEKRALKLAEQELENGETILWPFGAQSFQKKHIKIIRNYQKVIKRELIKF